MTQPIASAAPQRLSASALDWLERKGRRECVLRHLHSKLSVESDALIERYAGAVEGYFLS